MKLTAIFFQTAHRNMSLEISIYEIDVTFFLLQNDENACFKLMSHERDSTKMNIKMIIRFKKSLLFLFFYILILSFFISASIFSFKEKVYEIAIPCIIANVILGFSCWCRFFAYGIRINSNRVIAVAQSSIKVIPYNTVSAITVKFTKDEISALIKTKDQKEFLFVWDGIFLGTHVILPEKNNVSITSEFIEKSISELSKCEKVHIQNYYN